MTAEQAGSEPATPGGGGDGGGGDGVRIDCLVARRTGLPRDRMGHSLDEAGRWLLIQAAATLYGLEIGSRDLARDRDRRWSLPEHGLTASVAHCKGHSAVAFGSGVTVGVDLQDERDRPLALGWLGELLGHPDGRPASIRDFAECEALIKASHVTKETFAGVRLPAWRAGWRPTNVDSYRVCSLTVLDGDAQLAVVADRAAPVRWWWQPNRTDKATQTDALILESV